MSFFRTLVHHPRKLWLRRAFFQIHLWAGVLLSLYVVMIALTGSILVFRTELTRALLPKTLTPYTAERTAPIAKILDRFRATYPESSLENIQTPSQETPVFLLFAKDSHQHPFTLLADPVTANLKLQPRTWLYWTYELHVNLLLGEAHGVQINGVGGLAAYALGSGTIGDASTTTYTAQLVSGPFSSSSGGPCQESISLGIGRSPPSSLWSPRFAGCSRLQSQLHRSLAPGTHPLSKS
jgi:hypothetical protein